MNFHSNFKSGVNTLIFWSLVAIFINAFLIGQIIELRKIIKEQNEKLNQLEKYKSKYLKLAMYKGE